MSFFHRPKLGFSIHDDQLGDISDLGKSALKRARKSGFIKFGNKERFGEYDRDEIYLGATCYGYKAWQSSSLANI